MDGISQMTQPVNFHHPYTPYAIQETFMGTVYEVLERGNVGILESPTGTGKSLSLICGSLTWLRDHKGRAFEDGLNWGENETDEPDWIIDQARARKRRELLRNREDLEARLAKIRAKEKAQKQIYLKGDQFLKKRKVDRTSTTDNNDDEDQFLLDDYESDVEKSTSKSSSKYSAKVLEMLAKSNYNSHVVEEDIDVAEEIKIFYCSRTHSQLTQFINELRRVKFPPGILPEDKTKEPEIEALKHLTLGSRKNLCINPAVNKLNSVTAINERCLELQKTKDSSEHKCSFLPSNETQSVVNDFRDHALATIRDIEDMGSLGKQMGVCPYYASRSAIKPAEIVTLPYPLLLQKSAREALGLSLKGHVVIIDEAHNLMDAIAGIEGVEVSLVQLRRARAQLGVYYSKFKNRLKGQNKTYLSQLVRVIDSLISYLVGRLAIPKPDGIVNDNELLAVKGADQVNLFKLIKYLQESKLARKVEGYTLHVAELNQPRTLESTTPVLHHISSLLSALTHPSKEGRLFFSKDTSAPDKETITLKFLLLDPSTHFREIVNEARSVILAGGTMSPMADYTSHLFPYLSPTQITTLSCGHVIPASNLLAWNLSTGPSNKRLEFNFKERSNTEMLDELGRTVINVCKVVPDGVVIFFPSYAFLEMVVQRWSIIVEGQSIWQKLEAKKVLFQEKKEVGVDEVLSEYANAIDANKGGLLLSVVGGKMSEGINFSDRLGRCVMIVGLPFPNINTAEWKAKIEYIETATLERLQSEDMIAKDQMAKAAKDAGREFYENACMRAVNQSVGRAIRHREDYAAILMVDVRFGKESIKGKLPAWIREGLVPDAGEKSFGMLMGSLVKFFAGKKNA